MELLPIRRALLSVTDKSGLEEFARFLVEHGVELVSTGGTHAMLAKAGLPVSQVSEVTGFPEILDGRVKTLHPNIHAGILADKDNPEHLRTLKELNLKPFDLICVNLYNFAAAVRQTLEDKLAVEQIDIGGPTMIRASAKNFHSVAVLTNPSDYARCMTAMRENNGALPLAFRKEMAVRAFTLTSSYDHMIADYLSR